MVGNNFLLWFLWSHPRSYQWLFIHVLQVSPRISLVSQGELWYNQTQVCPQAFSRVVIASILPKENVLGMPTSNQAQVPEWIYFPCATAILSLCSWVVAVHTYVLMKHAEQLQITIPATTGVSQLLWVLTNTPCHPFSWQPRQWADRVALLCFKSASLRVLDSVILMLVIRLQLKQAHEYASM